MRSTPSLRLIPVPLWPVVVAPDRFLSCFGQIELFDIYSDYKQITYAKLNCLK